MKHKLLIVSFLVMLLIYILGAKRNQIRIRDILSIPYEGHETLLFSNDIDSLRMKLNGYENVWHFLWLKVRGINYNIENPSLLGSKGIICTLNATTQRPGTMIFNGSVKSGALLFAIYLDSLQKYDKVSVSNASISWKDVYKITTAYDTSHILNAVRNLYWSPTKGIIGFDIWGIDSPYVLTKIETEEN